MAIIERSNVVDDSLPPAFKKAGALAANDFAGQCRIGSLAHDETNGELYICTATNGSTTSTWVVVGLQT